MNTHAIPCEPHPVRHRSSLEFRAGWGAIHFPTFGDNGFSSMLIDILPIEIGALFDNHLQDTISACRGLMSGDTSGAIATEGKAPGLVIEAKSLVFE